MDIYKYCNEGGCGSGPLSLLVKSCAVAATEFRISLEQGNNDIGPSTAHISGRQTPGSTRGSPPLLYNKYRCEPQVKPGVWRPEVWALYGDW
jgi:hypothetical protein